MYRTPEAVLGLSSFPSAIKICRHTGHLQASEGLPSTATVPARLLESGVWQHEALSSSVPGTRWAACIWPAVAPSSSKTSLNPPLCHGCHGNFLSDFLDLSLCDSVNSRYPRMTCICATSLAPQPPHFHSVICSPENKRDIEQRCWKGLDWNSFSANELKWDLVSLNIFICDTVMTVPHPHVIVGVYSNRQQALCKM